jgi:hypothetical protein
LENLFSNSKNQNSSKNVTGLLLYNDGTFVQVLEGESSVVHSLFSKIENDGRHNQITIMMNRQIDKRLFNSYQTSSVAFGDLRELNKINSKLQLTQASKYTKSLWAILKPFFSVRQVGVKGYGI